MAVGPETVSHSFLVSVQSEFDALKSQINTLKQGGDVILLGDFNAKLEVSIPTKSISQTQSRNGEMLQYLLEETDTVALNTKKEICEWTREHRKRPDEKSIIDYAVVTKKTEPKVKEIRVDVEGTHRLKGKEETDHNSFILETNMEVRTKQSMKKTWKRGNPQDWANFNEDIEKTLNENEPKNFDDLQDILTKKMKKHIGQITIRNNKKKYTMYVTF